MAAPAQMTRRRRKPTGSSRRRTTVPPRPNGGRRQWILLGLSVMGLTASVTVLALFLPLIVADLTTSDLAVGFAIGVEGLAALTVPVLVGRSSDRSGNRTPYLLVATPLVAGGLLAVSLATTYWMIVAAVGVYFVGYYAYYTVYQALYPDTLPEHEYGRAWAYQSIFQGLAVGLALVGGGALFQAYRGTAFVVSAAVFVAIAIGTILAVSGKGLARGGSRSPLSAAAGLIRSVQRDSTLRTFLATHFLWEFTLAAIRAFVLLYLLKGLGLDLVKLLPLLAAVVAIYLVASLTSGQVTDTGNLRRYASAMIIAYGAAMLTAGLTTAPAALGILFPFGMFGGAAILMLAYPVLLKATDRDHRVEYTAYYQANRGLALLLGTSLTGLAIDSFGQHFPASHGYQVLWLVGAVAALASLPLYRRLPHQTNHDAPAQPKPRQT